MGGEKKKPKSYAGGRNLQGRKKKEGYKETEKRDYPQGRARACWKGEKKGEDTLAQLYGGRGTTSEKSWITKEPAIEETQGLSINTCPGKEERGTEVLEDMGLLEGDGRPTRWEEERIGKAQRLRRETAGRSFLPEDDLRKVAKKKKHGSRALPLLDRLLGWALLD